MTDSSDKKPLYGTVIIATCFSIQAIGIGTYVAYGVFFNPLMAEFGWSRAVISGASSLAFLILGLVGIFVGRFNDKIGPRILMTITAIFLGVGCILMSKLGAIWQLYVFYGIIFGIGMSSIDVIALTTVTRWFSKNRGMMTGIVKMGTGAGQFTLPLVATALISSYGWRNAYIVIGSFSMIILVVIAQLLKRDPGQRGHSMIQTGAKSEQVSDGAGINFSYTEARRTIQLWTVCLTNMALVFCLMTILVHVVPHARDMGFAPTTAASVLSTIGAVSMIGRFVAGIAADRTDSRKTMIVCFFMLIAALLWLQTADELWMLYVFACVYGLAHGGFFTAISLIVVELFGIKAHGALFGLVVCFGTIGGAIGPILAGYFFDITGDYSLSFWMITVMGTIGLGLILSLKPVETDIFKDTGVLTVSPGQGRP